MVEIKHRRNSRGFPILILGFGILEFLCSFGESESFNGQSLSEARATLSPTLETSTDYQLKVLSIAISYGGPSLLNYKDQFKEAFILPLNPHLGRFY
ncbi:hypothetical protein L1987_00014 [Smallanthus sonchifolius]|uniref:Uncharacterized protein n=1 Tax=Smallanthus sonchifolius TaxID=185202 RepID=A0ACB9K0X7_9ASTR|nr:hypothetical protein L1987_00014 [Smallanthus sonchifolius]